MRHLVCVALTALLAVPALARGQGWEYHVEEVDLITKVRVFANDVLLGEDDLEELLEPLGEDGWELVGTIARGGTSLLLIFKRPVAPLADSAPVSAPAPVPAPAPTIQTRPGEPPAPSPDKGGTPAAPVVPPSPTDSPAPAPAAPADGGQDDEEGST